MFATKRLKKWPRAYNENNSAGKTLIQGRMATKSAANRLKIQGYVAMNGLTLGDKFCLWQR